MWEGKSIGKVEGAASPHPKAHSPDWTLVALVFSSTLQLLPCSLVDTLTKVPALLYTLHYTSALESTYDASNPARTRVTFRDETAKLITAPRAFLRTPLPLPLHHKLNLVVRLPSLPARRISGRERVGAAVGHPPG